MTNTAGACPIEKMTEADWDAYLASIPPEEDSDEVDWPERLEPPLWMYDYSRDGNVIHFKRPKVTTFNDATVIGDLGAAHVDALLNAPAIVGTSDRAPRVAADKWRQLSGTWADVVNVLTKHPESAEKGGDATFFGESTLTGKTVNGVKLCHKLKDSIRRVFAIAIDVDGGCTVEQVIARIRELGLFAVIYTTHSHTTKGGPGSDRFRVIILLTEPFDMGTGADRDARAAEWVGRYVGLCEMLVPEGGNWDFTASRPYQLMYAPARPKGAAFKHYIIAGGGLDLSTLPMGDATPYRKRSPSGAARGATYDGEAAILSDGFDLLAWHADHGKNFLLSVFLEMIGWDVLSDAGDGFEILCPNAAAHSVGTGETAWAIDGPDAKNGAAIYCHHSHCADLRTCDFIRLLEDQCPDLPDGYETFSALICDPMFYPETVDGVLVEVNRADYVEEVIKIEWLKTPAAVKRAFASLDARSSRDAHAALYAGVAKGGGKPAVAAALGELIKESRRFSANDVKALEARGKELLKADNAAHAALKQEQRRADLETALTRLDLAHPSMDPAEPLGDDLQAALATLGKRYAVVDLDGKFRVVRTPDLDAFKSETDSTIAVYRMDDFLNLHLDRQVMEGDALVNPAKVFLETEKRKSGLVFAPYPVVAGPNDFNMYQGRKLKAMEGEWPTLQDFIYRVVCNADEAKYDWLILWMAHMVQFPGEKPGTAVICRGEGGAGKSTFGHVLIKLTAPHVKTLEKGGHVTGQFAGEHLQKCILAIITEAVWGVDPKVASELKALTTETTIQVEAKGMSLITVPSFIRLFFDSNNAAPVMIENNGSERRYFVMEICDCEVGNKEFFNIINAAIAGDEMAGLLDFLERYDPASAGFDWDDVRTAPETAERKLMGWHSMRPPMRRFKDVLQDGHVTLMVEGSLETFTADAVGLRVPRAAFRDYIAAAGDKRRAEDSDVAAMFTRLFPDQVMGEGQGRVGSVENARWWLFPTEVLGDAVDSAVQGTA